MKPDWDALQSAIAGEVVLPESPGCDACASPPSPDSTMRGHKRLCCARSPRTSPVRSCSRGGPGSSRHHGAAATASPGVPRREVLVLDVSDALCVGLRGRRDCRRGCPAESTTRLTGTTSSGWLRLRRRHRRSHARRWARHSWSQVWAHSDSLLAAQVVLANGRIVECDEHNEPDLFWALRGAGGCNFGVLTSLVFSTHPRRATAFHLIWPDTPLRSWKPGRAGRPPGPTSSPPAC